MAEPEKAPPKESDREKIARRIAEGVAEGRHPIATATHTAISFHARAAPRYARLDAPGFRCGSCSKQAPTPHGVRCQLAPTKSGPDVAPWWPACSHYTPKG